jgi:hypothetical protein
MELADTLNRYLEGFKQSVRRTAKNGSLDKDRQKLDSDRQAWEKQKAADADNTLRHRRLDV